MINLLTETITAVRKDKDETINLAWPDRHIYYASSHPLTSWMALTEM